MTLTFSTAMNGTRPSLRPRIPNQHIGRASARDPKNPRPFEASTGELLTTAHGTYPALTFKVSRNVGTRLFGRNTETAAESHMSTHHHVVCALDPTTPQTLFGGILHNCFSDFSSEFSTIRDPWHLKEGEGPRLTFKCYHPQYRQPRNVTPCSSKPLLRFTSLHWCAPRVQLGFRVKRFGYS